MIIGNTNLLIKLRELKEGLTPVEQRVAEAILEKPDVVPKMSIKLLAQRSGTSDASVLRFCKTLGFSGYREFIVSITSSLARLEESKEEEEPYADIRPGDELSTIVQKVARNNGNSILDTVSVLDMGEVAKAVDYILRAKRIYLFGLGASNLVCMDARQKFMRINKECQVCSDNHEQLVMASFLTPLDVAVIVSNSGNTPEILDMLDVIRAKNTPSIAVTRYKKSMLAERADVVLNISTPEVLIRSGAMGSRIAMLTIIDILFCCVASAEYEEVIKHLEETREIVRSVRKR